MRRFATAFFVSLSSIGCAPLTFSNEGAIDFSRYRTAFVEGDGADYLAGELSEISGFSWVTTDPSVNVDLVIRVAVFLEEHQTCECEPESDCDDTCTCDCEYDYEATASFVAKAPNGALVDSGTENDTSETPLEALEDVLDEVALHYARAYRL
jgi:hypothetical protein